GLQETDLRDALRRGQCRLCPVRAFLCRGSLPSRGVGQTAIRRVAGSVETRLAASGLEGDAASGVSATDQLVAAKAQARLKIRPSRSDCLRIWLRFHNPPGLF